MYVVVATQRSLVLPLSWKQSAAGPQVKALTLRLTILVAPRMLFRGLAPPNWHQALQAGRTPPYLEGQPHSLLLVPAKTRDEIMPHATCTDSFVWSCLRTLFVTPDRFDHERKNIIRYVINGTSPIIWILVRINMFPTSCCYKLGYFQRHFNKIWTVQT